MNGAYVLIEPSGEDVTVGLWCESCNAPSVVRVPIVIIDPTGVTKDPGNFYQACVDCGEWEEEE